MVSFQPRPPTPSPFDGEGEKTGTREGKISLIPKPCYPHNHRWGKFLASSFIIALVMALVSVRPVLAHGYLLRAIPEDRAVLEHAPARLQYWFSEPLEPNYTQLSVRDQAGNTLASGGASPDDASLATVRLPRGLPDGAYIVDMRLAFASDGHVVTQSSVFFVGEAVGGVNGQAASSQANALEVIWRTITLSSTLALFGAFSLYAVVLIPAWGSMDFRVGLLPPRVMHRLSWIIGEALVIAAFGNVLALLQQSMVFFNADLGQVISQQLWSAVRVGTRFGDLWTARMLLLALVAGAYGLSLFFRDEQPETVRPSWVASAWAMALVLATFSAGGHAAGSLLLPWVDVAVDWLHLLAVAFWVGGLGALVLVLPPALAPLEGEARRLALLAALRRFSRLATACVAIVITTGIYSALNWLYTPGDLTGTTYGGALILKVLLVGCLLLVALAHHIALRPERYQRWQAIISRVGNFIPTLRLEASFALLVLAGTGYLSATPVPPPQLPPATPPPSAMQMVGDLSVTMTLTPGGTGSNTYDTFITHGGQPVDGLKVQVQIVNPARDKRGGWLAGEDAESGLYIAAGGEIDQSGAWWSLADITLPDGTIRRAVFDWKIWEDAGVNRARPPGVLNLLVLAGVVGAVGWVIYPWAKRLYRRLDLRPATVTAAVMAILAAILFIALGIVLIQSAQAQYDATLNPPPKAVNTVLPDEASLERGQAQFNSACTGWTNTSELKDLVTVRTRDEALFTATRDGWRDLTACNPMTDTQRWDVVNYLRTLNRNA